MEKGDRGWAEWRVMPRQMESGDEFKGKFGRSGVERGREQRFKLEKRKEERKGGMKGGSGEVEISGVERQRRRRLKVEKRKEEVEGWNEGRKWKCFSLVYINQT